MQLVSCHLAPSSPARRLAEAEAFALVADRGPLIAGGDWNALPAGDPEPPGPVTGQSRRKLDRRPAVVLEETGLLDAGDRVKDTTPTVGHDSDLPYRCDRMYTTLPARSVTRYQVIATADDQSDHRPVLAEFDLGTATLMDGAPAAHGRSGHGNHTLPSRGVTRRSPLCQCVNAPAVSPEMGSAL